MAQEQLQLIITADNKDALKAIEDLAKSTEGLKYKFQQSKGATDQATQALVNLSRVAQDAPYGFMGIANNLNPLLESFQRLSSSAKDAGTSLGKELRNALMGPAGVGLALGVVSSLVVKFGDDIAKFVTDALNGKDALKEYKTALEGIGSGFTSAVEKSDKVKNAFEQYHRGIMTGTEALRIYNKQLGDNLGIKKDINDAEETYKNKSAAYVEASLQRALADAASKKAAEELLKQRLMAENPDQFKKATDVFVPGMGLATSETQKAAQANRQKQAVAEQETIIARYRKIAYDASAVAALYEKGFDFSLDPDKTKTKQDKQPLEKYGLELAAIKKRAELLKEIGQPILQTNTEDLAKADKKRLADIKTFGDYKMSGDFGKSLEGKTSQFFEEENKKNEIIKTRTALLKEQQEAYFNMADTISNYATNSIMGLFDAMERGVDIGEALGNMFMDLAKQIAAAAIKAAIFQAIISLLPGGAAAEGVAKSTGGFWGTFKGLLGLADGGIVTKPTLAMVGEGSQSEAVMPLSKLGSMMQSTFNAGAMASNVNGGGGNFVLRGNDLVLALNRSNYSLNLRRGV